MKYAVYKDNQIVGYIGLTTEQKDALNNIPGINITISPAPESETIPDKAGKYLWARIGVGFHVSDELHQIIKEAMFEDGPERVLELLDQAECSQDGDSYFPMDCRDNPNADWEFDF